MAGQLGSLGGGQRNPMSRSAGTPPPPAAPQKNNQQAPSGTPPQQAPELQKNKQSPSGKAPAAAIPDASKDALWEGAGPLKGCLLKNPRKGADYRDDGFTWTVIPDVWGNLWILLLSLIDGSQSDNTGQLITLAHQQAYQAADEKIMATAPDMAGFRPLTDDAVGITGLNIQNRAGGNIDGFNVIDRYYAGDGGAFLVAGADPAAKLMLYTKDAIGTFGDYTPDGKIAGVPASGRASLDSRNPYIDGVVIQIPSKDPNRPGVFVTVRANRFTRACSIIGLSFEGYGSEAALKAAIAAQNKTGLAAMWQILVALCKIVVGAIIAIFGGGVGMLTQGLAEFVSGWYTLAGVFDAHSDDIKNAFAPDGPLEKSGVPLDQAKGILDGLERGKRSPVAAGGSLGLWLLGGGLLLVGAWWLSSSKKDT